MFGKVKNSLSADPRPTIAYNEFERICNDHNVEDAAELSQSFHGAGVALVPRDICLIGVRLMIIALTIGCSEVSKRPCAQVRSLSEAGGYYPGQRGPFVVSICYV